MFCSFDLAEDKIEECRSAIVCISKAFVVNGDKANGADPVNPFRQCPGDFIARFLLYRLTHPALLVYPLRYENPYIPDFAELSLSEKLPLVEELWDVIAKDENNLPIPAWHEQALAEDAALYATNPGEGSAWADVKRRITG